MSAERVRLVDGPDVTVRLCESGDVRLTARTSGGRTALKGRDVVDMGVMQYALWTRTRNQLLKVEDEA